MSNKLQPKLKVTDLDAANRKPEWITDAERRKRNFVQRKHGIRYEPPIPFETTIEYCQSKQHAVYKKALEDIIKISDGNNAYKIAVEALNYEPKYGVKE